MVSRIVALAAFALVLAACAERPTERQARPSEAPLTVSNSPVTETAADAARVVCGADAVTIGTPVVRPQRDGVHLLVENPGRAWGVELHHESSPSGSAAGFKLSGGTTPYISAVSPGQVTVACVPTARSFYDEDGVLVGTLTIVDPDALYVPWDLACGFGEQFRMELPASPGEDPVSVLRRVPGVLPSDEVKRPKYPDSPRYYPMEFIVLRDGQAVARVMGPYYDEAWHVLINFCPASGISKR